MFDKLFLYELKSDLKRLRSFTDSYLDPSIHDLYSYYFSVLSKQLESLVKIKELLAIKGEPNYLAKTGMIIAFICS